MSCVYFHVSSVGVGEGGRVGFFVHPTLFGTTVPLSFKGLKVQLINLSTKLKVLLGMSGIQLLFQHVFIFSKSGNRGKFVSGVCVY